MLVNEASSAVCEGVASAADVDLAMRLGVAYPRGPLEWGDAIGAARAARVIHQLSAHYGVDRYRVSPYLARRALSKAALHE